MGFNVLPYIVESEKIPESMDGFRMAVLADLDEWTVRKEDQRLLLNFLATEPSAYRGLKGVLRPEDFTGPVYRPVAEAILGTLEKGEPVQPAAILSQFLEDEETRNQVAAVFHTALSQESTKEEREKILTETVRRLKRARLDSQVREETDPRRLQELILEKARLEALHIFLD